MFTFQEKKARSIDAWSVEGMPNKATTRKSQRLPGLLIRAQIARLTAAARSRPVGQITRRLIRGPGLPSWTYERGSCCSPFAWRLRTTRWHHKRGRIAATLVRNKGAVGAFRYAGRSATSKTVNKTMIVDENQTSSRVSPPSISS